jgi:hypothetical protein
VSRGKKWQKTMKEKNNLPISPSAFRTAGKIQLAISLMKIYIPAAAGTQSW